MSLSLFLLGSITSDRVNSFTSPHSLTSPVCEVLVTPTNAPSFKPSGPVSQEVEMQYHNYNARNYVSRAALPYLCIIMPTIQELVHVGPAANGACSIGCRGHCSRGSGRCIHHSVRDGVHCREGSGLGDPLRQLLQPHVESGGCHLAGLAPSSTSHVRPLLQYDAAFSCRVEGVCRCAPCLL